jgi:hypothetical protein
MMNVKGIGISLNADMVNGDLEALEKHIGYIADAGGDYVELIMHGLDVVIDGKVHPTNLTYYPLKRVTITTAALKQE